MSQVNTMKYRHQVCPFCNSKKISPRTMTNVGIDHAYGEATGYLCCNCNRYHPLDDIKYKTDRAEIRRDIKKLQKALGEGRTRRAGKLATDPSAYCN